MKKKKKKMMEKSLQQGSQGVVPDWNNLMGHPLGHAQPHPHMQFHFPQMPVTDQLHGEEANCAQVPQMMPFPSSKPRWGSCETLESVVRQATCRDARPPKPEDSRGCVGQRKAEKSLASMHQSRVAPRRRSCESKPGVRRKKNVCLSSPVSGRGGSAAPNAGENDLNAVMTSKLDEEESFSRDESGSEDEEGEARGGETRRVSSQSRCHRLTKSAATHNLSEQRRRDRINEKMKALQKLVPNSSKTDKASMLDEVIAYTKQLQGQVEMMKFMRSTGSGSCSSSNNHVNNPQMMNAMMMMMMMPTTALPPQQLIQMSLLARMGSSLGLGMLDRSSNAAANNPFISPPQLPQFPPHFLMTQMIPAATFSASQLNPNISGTLASMPVHDPYAAFLAQKMSMDDYYSKLTAVHRQQIHRPARSDRMQRQ